MRRLLTIVHGNLDHGDADDAAAGDHDNTPAEAGYTDTSRAADRGAAPLEHTGHSRRHTEEAGGAHSGDNRQSPAPAPPDRRPHRHDFGPRPDSHVLPVPTAPGPAFRQQAFSCRSFFSPLRSLTRSPRSATFLSLLSDRPQSDPLIGVHPGGLVALQNHLAPVDGEHRAEMLVVQGRGGDQQGQADQQATSFFSVHRCSHSSRIGQRRISDPVPAL